MTKEQATSKAKVRKLAKMAYGRAAVNDEVCIEGVEILEEIINTGEVVLATDFLKRNIRTCINAHVLSWQEIMDCFKPFELERVGIFTEGRHTLLENGYYIFAGSSIGSVAGYSHVEAYGGALVDCDDQCFVWAFGNATANLKGGMFWSFGNSRVTGKRVLGYQYDTSTAKVCEKSKVSNLRFIKKAKLK